MNTTYSSDVWREKLLGWQASGLSGQAYCRQEGLTYHQFAYWRKKHLTASQAAPDAVSTAQPGFVKVIKTAPTHGAELTLTLPNGFAIAGLNAGNIDLLSAILRQL